MHMMSWVGYGWAPVVELLHKLLLKLIIILFHAIMMIVRVEIILIKVFLLVISIEVELLLLLMLGSRSTILSNRGIFVVIPPVL
jgi:hypothetical protein